MNPLEEINISEEINIDKELELINQQVKSYPLTKEEFKKHFVEKTKELNLTHTFNVDEAYEIGQELVRRQTFRDKIVDFEKLLRKNPLTPSEEEMHLANPVKETFTGGCYIREIFNPADSLIITKIHKKEHPFFLLEGKMSILTEEGIQHLKAPYSGITKPGTKRIIYTHTNCVFTTVHSIESTTTKDAMKEIIAENYNDPAVSLREFEELKQNINTNIIE